MTDDEKYTLGSLLAAHEPGLIIKFIEKLEDDYCLAAEHKLKVIATHREQIRQQTADLAEIQATQNGLVRILDVAINGQGAAKQASLCDVVAQVVKEGLVALDYRNITALSRISDQSIAVHFTSARCASAFNSLIWEKIYAN